MKKKKINREKLTKILVYVFCFALVGLSFFSLFSVFVGAVDVGCIHSFFSDGVCNSCGYECTHWSTDIVYRIVEGDDTYHEYAEICTYCGHVWDSNLRQHNYTADGVCGLCLYNCVHPSYTESGTCTVCGHKHEVFFLETTVVNDQYHTEYRKCQCGYIEVIREVAHTYYNLVDGSISYCAVCGYECTHSDYLVTYAHSERDGYHLEEYLCAYCYTDEGIREVAHTFVNGACICTNECPHDNLDMDSGTVVYSPNVWHHKYVYYCADCGCEGKVLRRKHSFINGTCSACLFVCAHSDTKIVYNILDGNNINHERAEVCVYCGITWDKSIQEHEWLSDGTCGRCSYACMHPDYTLDGYCTVCGWMCTHSDGYELIYVPIPELWDSSQQKYHYDYMHWTRSVCVDCGQRMRNADPLDGAQTKCTYVDGVCTVCSAVCSHRRGYYNDGVKNDTCIRCKSVCDHSVGFDSNSKCKQCNYVCAHPIGQTIYTVTDVGAEDSAHVLQYTCGYCNTLYKTAMQDHRYKGTSHCNDCGYNCKHSVYDGITCKFCYYICPHEKYIDGICDECGRVCSHKWHNSTCKICNMVCADHTFTNGSLRCDLCDSYVVIEGYQQNDGFFRLMSSIYDAQANTFLALTDYNILGVNIAQLIVSIICLVIAIIVLKKVI